MTTDTVKGVRSFDGCSDCAAGVSEECIKIARSSLLTYRTTRQRTTDRAKTHSTSPTIALTTDSNTNASSERQASLLSACCAGIVSCSAGGGGEDLFVESEELVGTVVPSGEVAGHRIGTCRHPKEHAGQHAGGHVQRHGRGQPLRRQL